MCDHTGPLLPVPRVGGWPHILAYEDGATGDASVESMARALRQPSPQVVQASRYFDCVNFASRVRAQVASQWTVGFNDLACHPSSVYAAFNALHGSNHAMHSDVAAGHENTLSGSSALQAAVLRHFAANGHA